MGGLISTLGNLFGGSSVTTDRNKELEGFGDLSNVFNYGFNTGKSTFATGLTAEKSGLEQLGGPAAYYQKLLTGNRASALSAVAPTVNAVNSQTDAAAKQAATMGTARGGGVNAGQQQVDTAKQAAVENAITGAREGAASGAAGVASATAGIGSSMAAQALQLLGLGTHAATSLTSIADQSRTESDRLHHEKSKEVGDLTNELMNILFA